MDEKAAYREGEEEEEGGQGRESRSQACPQPQVMAFTTRSELGRYASELQLARIKLSDLAPSTNLNDYYAGGKVVSTYSAQLTQGNVVVLLQDDPSTERYVQCAISGDVTRLLPHSAELGCSELYVYGAGVSLAASECSQEMDVEITVDGEMGNIWIVNREAGNSSFLPLRHPSEFQGRGGNTKKARRQLQMKAGMESGRLLPSSKEPPTSLEPSAPTATSDPSTSPQVEPRALTPGSSTVQSHVATHYATGPCPQPSHPESLTSITPSHETQSREGEKEEDGGRVSRNIEEQEGEGEDLLSSSEDILSSSDNDDESLGSIGSEREGRGQDRTLFPYYKTSTRQDQSYSYTKLSDVEPGLQKVNVFGVVIDFQPPFQTKGRDLCSIVNIIDESLPAGQAFKCTFFHSNQDRLPKVNKVGDIVSFHRISIKLYPTGVQGIGQAFTSCLSFSGQLGSKVKPLTGSVSYTFTPQDQRRVKELRLWNARQSQRVNPFLRPITDITIDVASSDLVCQVLSISQQESTSGSRIAVLQVWDGTQTRHRSLALDLSALETTHVPNSELLQLLRISESFAERIVLYGAKLVESLADLAPGQFVCLQNVQTKLHPGQYNSFKDTFNAVELRLQPSANTSNSRETRVRVLESGDIEVFELKNRLRECRKSQTTHFRPLPRDIVPSDLTETPHCENQQPVALSALGKLEDTPAKFLCIVKVLGIEPCSVEGMVQLHCPVCKNKTAVRENAANTAVCTVCPREKRKRKRKAPHLQPMYFFKLELADETGHVKAYASGEQAARFLSGFPPTVFHRHPQQRMALLEQLYALTGDNDPFNSDSVAFQRPWVAVCLVSMATGTSSSSNGEDVTYHLFDTILKPRV